MRKHAFFVLALLALLSILSAPMSHAAEVKPATGPPQVGGVLPNVRLPVSPDPAENRYLGIKENGSFELAQIQADIVVVEIFSMYCPYCQKEAPVVNELYNIIADSEDLKDKIKLIGIGVGNTVFEVDLFRTQYAIPFPLFPDPDFSLHKALGETRTPCFIGIRIHGDGSHDVIHSNVGTIENPRKFLERLLEQRSASKGGN